MNTRCGDDVGVLSDTAMRPNQGNAADAPCLDRATDSHAISGLAKHEILRRGVL